MTSAYSPARLVVAWSDKLPAVPEGCCSESLFTASACQHASQCGRGITHVGSPFFPQQLVFHCPPDIGGQRRENFRGVSIDRPPTDSRTVWPVRAALGSV